MLQELRSMPNPLWKLWYQGITSCWIHVSTLTDPVIPQVTEVFRFTKESQCWAWQMYSQWNNFPSTHPLSYLLRTEHTPFTVTHTPRGYLEPPVDLNFYVFGWGPHYKARSVGIRPMTFLLWGDGAIHNPSMRRAPYNLCWPSTEWKLAASFSENYLRTGSLITGSSTWV